MSKLLKRLGGNGPKKTENFRSDFVRAIGVNDQLSGSAISSPFTSGTAPLAGYDTDISMTASSFSSLLSAAEANADFPPPPTPWMQSLEDRQRSATSGNHTDELETLEIFHTAPRDFHIDIAAQNVYENQQIIDRQLAHQLNNDKRSNDVSDPSRTAEYERANRFSGTTVSDQYAGLFENSESQRNSEDVLRSGQDMMIRSQKYEEPWDLSSAQIEVEDQFNGVVVGERILQERERRGLKNDRISDRDVLRCIDAKDKLNDRLSAGDMKGYEKPWDLKPHMKDDRGREGYERPWDLKPHHKDDRPPSEYDAPWDKKLKNVEDELVAAKIAKESARLNHCDARRSRGPENCAETSTSVIPSSVQVRSYADDSSRGQEGYEKPWDLKPHQRDDRPHDEYDSAWDGRNVESDVIAAKLAKEASRLADGIERRKGYRSGFTGVSSVAVGKAEQMSSSDAAGGQLRQTRNNGGSKNRPTSDNTAVRNGDLVAGISDRHQSVLPPSGHSNDKHGQPIHDQINGQGNIDKLFKHGPAGHYENVQEKTRVVEKLSSKTAIDEQSWYHGAIGRVDAELLLQGAREGSYLVRQSEGSNNEYSLSVKSHRGYIHMKIVADSDGRYILGQFSQPFQSVAQMVQHYSISKLPIKGAEHMSLMYPVVSEIL